MFIENKYRRWYLQLIQKARLRVLECEMVEWHHVVPRSFKTENKEVVALTLREHFIAHWLLTKCTTGDAQSKMRFALSSFKNRKGFDRVLTSRQYAVARRAWVSALTGRKRKAFSIESREKMSIAAKARVTSEKMAYAARCARGVKRTEEHKEKIRMAKLGDKNPMSRVQMNLRAASKGIGSG